MSLCIYFIIIILKRGSVCALYLLFVMMRRARFCSFDMSSHSNPQFVIPNWRSERINESYINFMAEKGKYCFSLFITPKVRDILLAIFCVWEFQFIYSFTVNHRKLNSVTRSIMALFIIRRGYHFPLKSFGGNEISWVCFFAHWVIACSRQANRQFCSIPNWLGC